MAFYPVDIVANGIGRKIMASHEIDKPIQKGTKILIGIPPRDVKLGDLLPENAIIQHAEITIDIRNAVMVSCEYYVKVKP